MASKAVENVEEKRETKVKALINLKYDTDIVKKDEEFLIRETDLKELQDRKYISYTEPVTIMDQVPPAK